MQYISLEHLPISVHGLLGFWPRRTERKVFQEQRTMHEQGWEVIYAALTGASDSRRLTRSQHGPAHGSVRSLFPLFRPLEYYF
jgi:hypothetical protein